MPDTDNEVGDEVTEEQAASTEKPATSHEEKTMDSLINERILKIKQGHETVKKYTLGAMAVSLVPIPLVDAAGITAAQLKMVHSISELYDVPFSKELVRSLIASLLGGSISVAAAIPVAISLTKLVPAIGYLSGTISMVAFGGASTYAIGKVFIEHFESGGTFLDFDPEKVRTHFEKLYEEGKQFTSDQVK